MFSIAEKKGLFFTSLEKPYIAIPLFLLLNLKIHTDLGEKIEASLEKSYSTS